jgi:hypothetical protein
MEPSQLPHHAAPAAMLTRRLFITAGVILALAVAVLAVPTLALLFVHPHH